MYWYIDDRNSALYHIKIKVSNYIAFILHLIIRKIRLCSAEVESFVDCWGQSFAGALENVGQDDAEHLGRILEVSLKRWLQKSLKNKCTTICVQNWTYVGNIKEKRALLIWNWGKTE